MASIDVSSDYGTARAVQQGGDQPDVVAEAIAVCVYVYIYTYIHICKYIYTYI